MTLAELKKDQKARIKKINLENPNMIRLMILGLVEDAEIGFISASLGGDPIEFDLYGSAISLRKSEAQEFQVEII
ncbi:MAG: FeoA domain-containing protein [Pseudomonadota bacterium]|nr:hypothetical protein [Gammaproteobacteria bacterium]MEE2683592.1 FeoA domain-containing protein [Pseudomonadota bacterium]|tara:strand:+ start:606 stop:830 length:225 start_codon:yes stop_codon:yes gene_type:complete